MNLETYISEFSKYVIALIILLYTLECYFVFLRKTEDKRKGVYARQNILMFAFHFSSFMVICFETEKLSYLVFYAFQQIVLYVAIMLYKSIYPKTNRLIINNMCMLLSISFVILTRLDYTKALKQFVIATGSLTIALIIPFFVHNLRLIKHLKYLYAILGITLLGIILVLGQTTYGSKISYSIAGITFQPAEFVKIIFVFFVASAYYKSSNFLEVCLTSIIAAIHVIIQVLNNDLGSALIFFVVYICMLYIATQKFFYMLLGILSAAGASFLAYQRLSHVRVRVQAFLDPWTYIDSSGYQITQSLFAISSGGWFGLGLFKGTPKSIPFVTDDFIFSAITEEFGVIFAICLIMICVSCFIMFMRISIKIQDKFYQLLAFGMSIAYIFQVFLTIGGGTKFIPLTGVTLPLVSYGGSSILTTIIMFAIIEGIYMINEDMQLASEADSEIVPRRNRNKKPSIKSNKKASSNDYYKKAETKNNNRHRTDDYDNRYKDNSYDYEDEYDEDYEEDSYEYDEEYGDFDENVTYNHAPYEDSSDDSYDDPYDDSYDEEYEEENDNNSYIEDDMEFLHGFTRPIDVEEVKAHIDYDDEEPIGEIYYNEEEYEKDKRNR